MAVTHLETDGVLAIYDRLQGARLHTSSTASTADTSSAAAAQGTGSQGGSATSVPAGCSGSAASASSLAAASNLGPTGALVPSASVPGPHTGTSQHDAPLEDTEGNERTMLAGVQSLGSVPETVAVQLAAFIAA